MARFTLTDSERALLQRITSHTPDPKLTRRAQALLLLDQGETALAVADRLGVSRQTIYLWVRSFRRGALPLPPATDEVKAVGNTPADNDERPGP